MCWINYKNRYVGSLTLTLGSLTLNPYPYSYHCQLVTSLSLFSRCYFGDVPLKLLYWFHVLFNGRSTCYSNRMHHFSVIISKSYMDVYFDSFFTWTVKLRTRMISFDLLPIFGFFLVNFLICFSFFSSFAVTPCIGCLKALHAERISIKKVTFSQLKPVTRLTFVLFPIETLFKVMLL